MTDIIHKKKLVGILLRAFPKGSIPHTDGQEPLQLVTLKHPKGQYLLAHMHKPLKRTTTRLQECLIVRKGRIRIDIYGPDKKMFKKVTLKAGDVFILLNGGYGIHMLEASELIELKNGPFKEDKVLL
jgi:hypothetical protein